MHISKVILTGYRATGKSSVGKKLASRLSFNFIDMDQLLEEREGTSIQEIVAAKGWPYFRGLEKNLLQESTNDTGVVIGTGGGAILHQEIWPQIMDSGLVVWLSADTDTICQRLLGDEKTQSQRPSLTGTDTYSEVTAVLAEREPLYRKGCHLSVDTGTMSIEEVVAVIERQLKG